MMRMSDIVSKMGATFFIEVALVLFFAVFVGVLVYAYGMLKKEAIEQYAAMPLEDDKIITSSSAETEPIAQIKAAN